MGQPCILTRSQVRELDRRAVEELGIPSFTLMENAAREAAREAQRLLRAHGVSQSMNRLGQPDSKDDIPRTLAEVQAWKDSLNFSAEPTVVLCGPGNNGGDGLALARTLRNRGHAVSVIYCGPRDGLASAGPDVQHNAGLLAKLGIALRQVCDGPSAREIQPLLHRAPLIVDALFGTGLTRAIEDPQRAVIQLANESPAVRLALDLPSGLDADTGEVLGICLRADVTITFAAHKPGFARGAGPACCGKIIVAEIGIPQSWIDAAQPK